MSTRAPFNRPVNYSEGVVTNPNGTSDFAVDTDALTAGTYEGVLTAGGTAATAWTVQHRNAANDDDVATWTVYTPADASGQYAVSFTLAASERVRVLPSSETGDVCANLALEQVQ